MAEKVRISQRVVYSNGLFTPLTRTRQVSCRPCEHNIVDATKLSSLVRIGGVNKLLVANCKLGRDKTKLYCRRCEHNWWQLTRQDKTRGFVSSASAVWTRHKSRVVWCHKVVRKVVQTFKLDVKRVRHELKHTICSSLLERHDASNRTKARAYR